MIDWLLVVLITLLTGWVALVGLAFLPLYWGPVPAPVSALLGVGAMILGPRACYRLTGSLLAAVLPVASWFVVSVWLALLRNPVMPSVAVTVIQGQWRVMLLFGLGSLAAAATVSLLWADRLKGRLAAQASRTAPPIGEAAGDDPAGGSAIGDGSESASDATGESAGGDSLGGGAAAAAPGGGADGTDPPGSGPEADRAALRSP